MILVSQLHNGTPPLLLGHRRSITNPAAHALNLSSAQREPDLGAASRPGTHLPLPMSGSPSLPLKAAHEVTNRGEMPSPFAASQPQDGFRSGPPQSPLIHLRDPASTIVYPMARTYPPEQQGTSYPHHFINDNSSRSSPYLLTSHRALAQAGLHQPYLPPVGASSTENYPIMGRTSAVDNQPYTSPKSQRKTKGHVASACVPCKRAHLRCDAQRPCSRCLGNGKEDNCIDVQHKKRGRPRLRDERDSRYDPTRFQHSQDPLRRPLSIFPSAPPASSGYGDTLRRAPPIRPLDSQPGDAPLYHHHHHHHQRVPTSSATFFSSPPSTSQRSAEPLAYLNMEFEVMKASPSFVEGVQIPSLNGQKLSDLVAPSQASLVHVLQGQLINEQRLNEPNYLPPIIGRVDNVIQQLGFGIDDAARFAFQRQEYLSFIGSDSLTRTFPVRLGLAKQDSHYFVVIALNMQPPSSSPSQQLRDRPMNYHHQPTPPQSVPSEPQQQQQQQSNTSKPPPFEARRDRPDYASLPTHQGFRNDIASISRPTSHFFQLPPIRSRSEQRPPDREPGIMLREERPSRVDIGGIIDRQPASSVKQW